MILAANRCRDRAPSIYVADSLSDIAGILNPKLGDIVMVVSAGALGVWRLMESDASPDGVNVIASNTCEYVWIFSGGEITAELLGIIGDDSTDNTIAINSASAAIAAAGGGELVFGAGIFRHNGIVARQGVSFRGAGSGRMGQGAATVLLYTGSGVAVQKSGTSRVFSFSLKHLCLRGTDGAGATGLLLDSFQYGWFEDILIGTFRGAGSGLGLRMINNHGLCCFNRFIGLTIEDSDTALEIDSTNGVFSSGYNSFFGLVIYQEEACILINNTAGNGGIYNNFFGVSIQGRPGATGKYIVVGGHGNMLDGVIIDQAQTGNVLEFPFADSNDNYVRFIGGFDVSKYVNNQSVGANNTVDFGGFSTRSPGRPFTFQDPSGQTELSVLSTGANAVEFHIGNDVVGSQGWRMIMSATGSTLTFTKAGFGNLLRLGSGLVESLESMEITGELDVSIGINLPNTQTVKWASSTGVEEAGIGVSSGNNMQVFSPTQGGNIQLIARNIGNSIQFLPGAQNGATVDANSDAGNTRLMLFDSDSGLLQRVKVGANGTGPGGVGRALYLDNA